jgi:ABC-2 type transport system ATP-binding protein
MLRIKNLTKNFGTFTAVNNLSIHVRAGEFYGFLGPNGAGKTTTIKMITGLYAPTSGSISIDEIDTTQEPIEVKYLFGYIPDQPFLYDKLTGLEFLYFSGGLYNLDKDFLKQKIKEVAEKLKIGNWINKRTEEYSQGMRQRITFASALLHDPKLLVIDEPMVGLDPQSAVQVKELLKEKASKGTAIFMSTHSLPVAEELCTKIGIIKDGHIIFEDKKEAVEIFKKQYQKNFESLFLELTS